MIRNLIIILFSLLLMLSAGCILFPKKEEPAELEEIEEDVSDQWEWEITPDTKETMKEELKPVQSEFIYPLEKVETEPFSTKIPQGKKTEIIFNFQNADIKEVLKVILGDIMGLNYTMDKRVTGAITLRTEGKFNNNELLDIIQATLNINGFAIVKSENIFKILPIQEARTESSIVPLDRSVKAGGEVITQIVPLKHVAPQVIIPTLRGLLTKAGFVIAPNDTHAIIISDKVTNIGKLLKIIKTFDVPFFAGKALKFYDIKYADPVKLAKDLEKIVQTLGASTKAPKLDMAFIPFEDTNKLLAATGVPEMMESIDAWISNIDVHVYENVPKMYIYKMQHEKAETTVPILTELFKEKITPAAGDKGAKAIAEPMKIIADKNTNSIIAKALPADYYIIKSIIEALDATPQQVLIEAIIAEVTLTDAMANGVEYFFRNKGRESEGGSISLLPTGVSSFAEPLLGDGTKFFSINRDIDIFISAVASETNVEIISSPHILVRDEQTASIQVGESEPIRAGSTTGSGGVTTAQIQYRDTGTILTVTPRIGENSMVTLDVKQEISDAIPTEDSSIDSPTFTTRVTETSLVVKSGHVIYLGGIINIEKEEIIKKVPLLGDIPLLGNAFKSHQNTETKTELMVLITPHITSTASEADTMTREFKEKLKEVAKITKRVQ
ncbi:MAG: type II secretion system secretin GspD [Planctomycetota bacterium]